MTKQAQDAAERDWLDDFDHHPPEFVTDPWPMRETLRTECLVVHRIHHGARDFTALEDLDPFVRDADLLLLEVAHYDGGKIGIFVRDLPATRVALTRIHPGPAQELQQLVEGLNDPRIEVACDGMRVSL